MSVVLALLTAGCTAHGYYGWAVFFGFFCLCVIVDDAADKIVRAIEAQRKPEVPYPAIPPVTIPK